MKKRGRVANQEKALVSKTRNSVGSTPTAPTTLHKMDVFHRRPDGVNVFNIDLPWKTKGKNRFQVIDTQLGQIVVEARSRRACEARLLNLMLSGRFVIMQHGRWEPPRNFSTAIALKVVKDDGRKETIQIREPISIQTFSDGSTVLKSAGMDHFFLPDGRYCGWGTNTSNANANQYEKNRKIED